MKKNNFMRQISERTLRKINTFKNNNNIHEKNGEGRTSNKKESILKHMIFNLTSSSMPGEK